MIRSLRLKDWRNYADVELRFEEGVTFVVATNGVGKTSMVEAARWALFGVMGPTPGSAVRVGADYAEAQIEVVVPSGRALTVSRRLTRPRTRTTPQPDAEATIDGVAVTAADLPRLLTSEFAADTAFLARLTMPALDRNDDKPHTMGLENHLGQLFGIDSLRSAITKLEELKKANDRDIRGIKQDNAASAKRLADLSALVEHTARNAQNLSAQFDAATAEADRIREWFRTEADRTRWESLAQARTHRLEDLASRATQLLAEAVTSDTVHVAVSDAAARIDDELNSLRVEAAVAAARAEDVTANARRLDDSHIDCPVCRRPLDEDTVAGAHTQANLELEALDLRLVELARREVGLAARRAEILGLRAELATVGTLAPQPAHADETQFTDEARDNSVAAVARAMEALVEARATATQAERDLAAAKEADEAMRELERLFRREAKLRVAVETTRATLDEVLETTVDPIASEVNQRWSALFPGRGALKTRADGTITRQVNGHDVPFDSFSTGEGMGATILLRLVVAHVASVVDFVWLDEPLEHLDPEVRRHVANMLSRVTSDGGRIRQVVVTTYEEPLVRQLRARDTESVHLIDVRQTVSGT